MSIDVGQTLDKYDLLERVGQGGMACVYRGFDRALEREVAVKVLHHHLAGSREARERFEREARAVAKLHHENILEIYDFSGVDSEESYIVAEFIDGTTLRDFVSEHAIQFPEVGAMIAVQVCRALSHAHSLGILHRDIKPENIMIREDGVVKLTDFGIAQIVDLQRMTVTGQLLGSPAYMSPEHVDGGRLDFRTDVFSTGILLYQLVTGTLPFSGRNPHEVLKRIADGRYKDPRALNPLIGDTLARIISRALARRPVDRYPDVTLMLGDLDRYLSESGLTNHPEELSRYFGAPVAYEMALRPRLVDALTRRGRELLERDRVAALEAFNRVLTLEPDNSAVLEELERVSRRRRGARAAVIFGAIALAGTVGLSAKPLLGGSDEPPGTGAGERVIASAITELRRAAGAEAGGAVDGAWDGETPGSDGSAELAGGDSPGHAGRRDLGPPPAAEDGISETDRPADEASGESEAERQVESATTGSESGDADGASGPQGPDDSGAAGNEGGEPGSSGDGEGSSEGEGDSEGLAGTDPDDAGDDTAHDGVTRTFPLRIYPPNSEYRLGDGAWESAADGHATVELDDSEERVVVSARNEECCEESRYVIEPDAPSGTVIELSLGYLPGHIIPVCDADDVRVQIDERSARLGRPAPIFFEGTTLGTRTVEVAFFKEDASALDRREVRVAYDERREVECDL